MREIITLQVGQCGNQLGNEFWRKIANEHGVGCDGVLEMGVADRKDRFFYQTDDGRFVPRAVLIDSEPRVIGACHPFFNADNIFVCNEGGGAGNNWAQGFYMANKARADVSEVIQREAEACDILEGFTLIHSVAGGTGSGFGSLLVEDIRDRFPKQLLSACSVLPANTESSDVVVQPYNTVLTLSALSKSCDSITIMDNHALGRIAMDSSRVTSPNFNIINMLAATVLSAATSTIRFPTHAFCDARSIYCSTVPVPALKFIVPSYTPFLPDTLHRVVRKTTASDILRRLLLPKTSLCTYEFSSAYSSVSILNILEGTVLPGEISRAVACIHSNSYANFVPWMPPFYQTAISNRLPEYNRVSGLALNNTTGVSNILSKISLQFDQLSKRNAFVDLYRKFDTDLAMFADSRESIQAIVDLYSSAETSSV